MSGSDARPLVSRSSQRTWATRHPVPVFVGLAYLVSWTAWWPLLLADAPVRTGVGWPAQMPGLLGPAVAAVVVTWCMDGGRG